jgi:hypothetical protein
MNIYESLVATLRSAVSLWGTLKLLFVLRSFVSHTEALVRGTRTDVTEYQLFDSN